MRNTKNITINQTAPTASSASILLLAIGDYEINRDVIAPMFRRLENLGQSAATQDAYKTMLHARKLLKKYWGYKFSKRDCLLAATTAANADVIADHVRHDYI